MPTNDPVKEYKEERKEQKREALAWFHERAADKMTLKRPVFFVPGWTDETCQCWTADEGNKICIKTWLERVCDNCQFAHFINFEEESEACDSFLDFGGFLKEKVQNLIGDKQDFDIVGHSMGGLDTRAAVVQKSPLLNIHKCVTVATPHWGDHLGGIDWFVRTQFKRMTEKILGKRQYSKNDIQGRNLDPDYEPVKIINRRQNRELFLERVQSLHLLSGTRDFCVKGSAIMDAGGIEDLYERKVKRYEPIEGANHTGTTGICKDPRTVDTIIKILLDIPLPEPDFNYGNVGKG